VTKRLKQKYLIELKKNIRLTAVKIILGIHNLFGAVTIMKSTSLEMLATFFDNDPVMKTALTNGICLRISETHRALFSIVAARRSFSRRAATISGFRSEKK
jgi:hypothetical protein